MAFRNRKHNYPLYETTHFKDIREMVENVADRYPDRYALSYRVHPNDKDSLHITYEQGRAITRDIGTEFAAMGLRRRNVALIGEASADWFFSYFALMASDVVSVPVDKELPVDQMASILNTVGCVAVIFSASVCKKVQQLRDMVPTLQTYIAMGMGEHTPDFAVDLAAVRERGAARYAAGDRSYYEYDLKNDQLATIVFTSGTTGKGKGVMLSAANICSDMEQGMYNFQITERTMFVLPPHHTFGSTVNLVGHYAQGCEIYISSGIRYILNELKSFRPTSLVLVPLFVETFYKRIMTTAEKQGKLKTLRIMMKVSDGLRKIGIDLRRVFFKSVLENFGAELSMIICGGAALPQDIIDFFEGIGITILNGYGITECAPLISCNRNECRKNGSVGIPIIGGEIKILDPDENGEGEICYRGPNCMMGYYHDDAATAAAFDAEGFFKTGDYGKIVWERNPVNGKDDPWIYITGRLKNLIIFSNGKNVYPEEIENDIRGVYGVSEVVVYAGESKSDPKKEVIVAEIYPDADAMALRGITDPKKYFEDAVAAINAKNVSYKSVGYIKIRKNEFPKNTSRKITRFVLDKTIE